LDLAASTGTSSVATKEDLHVMVAVMEEELEKVRSYYVQGGSE